MRRPPRPSDVDRFSDAQGVFEFDAQISNRAVHLRVTEQELHRAQIAGLSVDLRRLGAPQRVRAVPLGSRPIADTQSWTRRAYWRVETCGLSWNRLGNRKAQPIIPGRATQAEIEVRVFSVTSN